MTSESFDQFCGASLDFLTTSDVPFLLVGGLAVAALGEPRFTADVDVVAFVTMETADRLIASAEAAGFTAAEDEADRLKQTGTLRFGRGRYHLDIIVASLPFEERAYRRAVCRRLFGRDVSIPTPEDMLLFKIVSGREKDVLDAVGIARRHTAGLNWTYIASGIDEICDLAEHTGPRAVLATVRAKAAAEPG